MLLSSDISLLLCETISLSHNIINLIQLSAWNSEVEEAASKATGGPPTSSIIRAFLENAGQKVLLDDLVKTENNFCAAMDRLKRELLSCIMVRFYFVIFLLLLVLGKYHKVRTTFECSELAVILQNKVESLSLVIMLTLV